MMLPAAIERLEGGRRLSVVRLGAGHPVVLLHGYPENLQIWSALAPRLAAGCAAIAFDWPGMGRSDAWPGGATPHHMAARLRELLDYWSIERASLIGADMGGQPALAFAAEHPERVERVVVMNSLVIPDAATSWEIRLLRRFRYNQLVIARFPRLVLLRAERTFLPSGMRLSAQLRREFRDCFLRPEVRRFVVRMCAAYQGSLRRLPECYAHIRAPTLVLWGEHDRHFPVAHAHGLHRAIAGSRLEIVRGGEHWMAWHRADEVAERISLFMRSPPGDV